HIRKVAVVGSGVMGSRIACHFAGIGVQVLLLDIPAPAAEEGKKSDRNKIVNDALQQTLKSKPSAIYTKEVASLIRTGNIEDDLHLIADCDWVMEVVVERLDIKQKVFEQIERHRKPGTLITSNTSGIPIHLMNEGRSEDFRRHFCGTHFFNPPRYLRLLEIIPAPDTDPAVLSFLMDYGERFLGKTTVMCKDTPAFIANRVGVFGFMAVFHAMQQLDLNIDEVDALTGTILGRPKSATFRTGDVVGLDTLVHVAKALPLNAPNDEAIDIFRMPGFLEKMIENKWLGDKTGQGFYKKVKVPDMPPPSDLISYSENDTATSKAKAEKAGFTTSPESRGDERKTEPIGGGKTRSEIYTLNLQTMEYEAKKKSKFATIEAAKPVDDLAQRLK
ncbi:MAG: 3-hydroxyacyl-CoA dehydrogenase family protein, partial [Sphingobacteriales bacterium]